MQVNALYVKRNNRVYVIFASTFKGNFFNIAACAANKIDGVPTEGQTHCALLPECDGIECCFDNAFYLGNRSVYFKIRMGCTDLEFHIESKKIVKSLASLSDGMSIRILQVCFLIWNFDMYRYETKVVLLIFLIKSIVLFHKCHECRT